MSETPVVIEQHGHAPFLQHHFHTAEQQADASKIGMWLFLVTEVLLFGGLFVGFAVMQSMHPEAFFAAHHHLDRTLGLINTLVLLVSSYTMVMAVDSARRGKQRALMIYLLLTLMFAAVFLGIKYIEYSHKFHEGLLPGKYYSHAGDTVPGQFMFFSFYFMMTGLHGIHIVLGMAAITWLCFRARRGDFSPAYYTPVDMVGLYWHLVDIIWIYLFPLLYLIQ
ncbi:MAG TPA: cytochrome c oxidase subunit 3 family protein [Bryobacteraceae bacterium]|nr:cytochrome c oxidase subunit 3 family protein [Bryobacteraceae bacterium]HOQ47213.1 cytochrome c oxidase subunit 3 family protein [Bryobacteraceae bacterium]HPU74091.1 cytochrome c oxidase subunit 3 family protein [Bryobacteraceae bacterium]